MLAIGYFRVLTLEFTVVFGEVCLVYIHIITALLDAMYMVAFAGIFTTAKGALLMLHNLREAIFTELLVVAVGCHVPV